MEPLFDIRRILVIQRDPMTRRVWGDIFRRFAGWHAETAGGVTEALRLLDPPTDCILTGVVLTDGGGDQIIRHVRDRGLRCRIVIFTGCTKFGLGGRSRESGADHVIIKPASIAEVFRACGVEWTPFDRDVAIDH